MKPIETEALIESLCNDRSFLHEALKSFLMDGKVMWNADPLSIVTKRRCLNPN